MSTDRNPRADRPCRPGDEVREQLIAAGLIVPTRKDPSPRIPPQRRFDAPTLELDEDGRREAARVLGGYSTSSAGPEATR